jgi:hypothetical protein
MTIVSLLSHLGVQVPRGVTVDGRILTLSQAAATGTPIHELAPQTFHGGADPETDNTAVSWWEASPEAKGADVVAMGSAFPGFVLLDESGAYDWIGEINTGRGRFKILIRGNASRRIPMVRPLLPSHLGRSVRGLYRRSDHLFLSGSLCLADDREWNPDVHNTVTAVGWAAHWFAAYTEWRINGIWPTPGYYGHAA